SRHSETDAADVLPNPLRAAGRPRRNRLPEEPATTAPKLMPHPATIVLPTHVRYARTPDKLRQMEAALAAEAAMAAEPAPGAPKAGTRVKFGRTPDHLIQQVWKGILPAVPPQEDVQAGVPVATEVPAADGHAPAAAASTEEPLAAEAPPAAPLEPAKDGDVPFVAISDHAFFEFDCSSAVLPATPAGWEAAAEEEVASPPAADAPEAYAGETHEPETDAPEADASEVDEPAPEEQAAPAAVSADAVEAWWSH